MLVGRRVVVTGGTGSLGQVLVRRMIAGELGFPREVVIFSRDEAKQHAMRLALEETAHRARAEDRGITEVPVRFRLGDIAVYDDVCAVLRDADVVFHTAAMKQVPSCEYAPAQAIRTNVIGTENVVRAIRDQRYPVQVVVGISSDKACKPINVMGMTKALQERILIQANLDCPDTRFVATRYGNVLSSRGSVIPQFHQQIRSGGPLTVTTADMTRFLMSVDQAAEAAFAAARHARHGEIHVPRLSSARIADLAEALIGDRPIDIRFVGIRPAEKTHELLVAEEEAPRTVDHGDFLTIRPSLKELVNEGLAEPALSASYSSADHLMSRTELARLLAQNGLLLDGAAAGSRVERPLAC